MRKVTKSVTMKENLEDRQKKKGPAPAPAPPPPQPSSFHRGTAMTQTAGTLLPDLVLGKAVWFTLQTVSTLCIPLHPRCFLTLTHEKHCFTLKGAVYYSPKPQDYILVSHSNSYKVKFISYKQASFPEVSTPLSLCSGYPGHRHLYAAGTQHTAVSMHAAGTQGTSDPVRLHNLT